MSIQRKFEKLGRKLNYLFRGHGRVNYRNQGIINFIDVGSASGSIPDPWYANSKFIKYLLCFDPHNTRHPNNNIIVSKSALWSKRATLPFYIYKGLNQSGSSLFEQNIEFVKENYSSLKSKGPKHLSQTWFERTILERTITIPVETLDQVIDQLDEKIQFDFLKIDAQGAEYEILQGSEQFLRTSCLGLQLELFNIPLYKGIKLESEVTSFLDSMGFHKVKKYKAHGSFDSQNDYVFLRKDCPAGRKEKMNTIKKIYKL